MQTDQSLTLKTPCPGANKPGIPLDKKYVRCPCCGYGCARGLALGGMPEHEEYKPVGSVKNNA